MIHVCSLARLHTMVEDVRASHVITLLKDASLVSRPQSIAAERHLVIGVDDITAPLDGYIAPAEEHVADLLKFVRRWERSAPLVVHCYAGISRSTAGAFIAACALNPNRDESGLAQSIRRSSPTAMPNTLLVSIADRMLKRNGRMIAAVEALGRGLAADEGHPFHIDLD
jgi:predicted protein tyrosine phosphatase